MASIIWTERDGTLTAVEGHGREDVFDDINLSRTVGWFTSLYPVRLDPGPIDLAAAVAGGGGAGTALIRIKEQLRAIPGKGLGYGLLRYLNPDTGPSLAGLAQPEIVFNYLGQFDLPQANTQGFGFAPESTGAAQAATRCRDRLIDINALVVDGSLRLGWNWCRSLHEESSMTALAQRFLQALNGLISHCLTPGVGRYTASDFPLARLTQPAFEALASRYSDLEDVYPLSSLQQGLLFHALYAGAEDPYLTQLCLDLSGSLDIGRLHRAWEKLFDRHAVLRSAIVQTGDTPLQVVRRGLKLPWQQEVWSGLDEAAFENRLNEFLSADRTRGLDFAEGPLLRVTLLTQTPARHVLVFSHHHLLLDGWSIPILLRELLELYVGLQATTPPDLPRTRPYRNYITWLATQDPAAAAVFWQHRLKGFAEPVRLSIPAPATLEAGIDEYVLTLPEEWTVRLQPFARRNRLTLNTLVQGAWAILLARYSGQSDIVFGITSAGRPAGLSGVEGMVGLFLNTLPARVSVNPTAVLGNWLHTLQSAQAESQTYGHIPLPDIHKLSALPTGQSLFDTLLVFENYPIDAALRDGTIYKDIGFTLEGVRSIERTNHPLSVAVSPGRALGFRLHYDRVRFDEITIARLAGHLQTLLQSFALASPDTPLHQLESLTAQERKQVLYDFNDTAVPYPQDATLPELFEAQVARTPDAVAVVFEDKSLTYGELNQRANQLAHYLIGAEAGPETIVGIALERSPEMIVALLAILKAGAAYLPLDPAYPAERLALMVEDASAKLIITTTAVAGTWPPSKPLVCLDAGDIAAALTHEPASNPTDAERISPLRSNNLAYVIYTSGSTGKPKGVGVASASLFNYLQWCLHSFNLNEGRGAPINASLSFDGTTPAFQLPLNTGKTIWILPSGHEVENLAEIILKRPDFTLIKCTPSSSVCCQLN